VLGDVADDKFDAASELTEARLGMSSLKLHHAAEMAPYFPQHITWDEVYARQMQRANLVPEWMEALGLAADNRVLEIGAGPGYVSLVLADRVGANGVVYAVDRSAEALAHLERRQNERGASNVRRFIADAATLKDSEIRADSALVTMVLHHADDPSGVLRNLHRLLPPHAKIIVAEFHPEGPCEQGAPRAARLTPEQVQAWCQEAGFHVRAYKRQSPEHYMLIAERSAMDRGPVWLSTDRNVTANRPM
jgi:ubiquinone/menaquinone biosynthesis C-methylase UbiE